jgi:hypothetical protein
MIMIDNFTQLHYIIGVVVLSYGVVQGISNTFYRILSIFGKVGGQNTLGMLLDMSFYTGIGYLGMVYYGVMV